MRRTQHNGVGIALLVLKAIDRVKRRRWRLDVAAYAQRELPAQRDLALFVDISRLAESGLPDHGLEGVAVELAIQPAEARVSRDEARDLVVRSAEPHAARFLIQHILGHHLADQLLVEAERASLVRRDRPAKAAAKLVQLVGVVAAELLDRDVGAADLGDGRRPEAAENVIDAPDRETHDEGAHDEGHHHFAEPGAGRFIDTAEHGTLCSTAKDE